MGELGNTDQWMLLNQNGFIVAVRRTRSECIRVAESMWIYNWRQIKRKLNWSIERCVIAAPKEQE